MTTYDKLPAGWFVFPDRVSLRHYPGGYDNPLNLRYHHKDAWERFRSLPSSTFATSHMTISVDRNIGDDAGTCPKCDGWMFWDRDDTHWWRQCDNHGDCNHSEAEK
ncbi:MAG: hypothetical protein CMB80_31115 [Flammeovirgaceae bacterium]|nr:hypothetical protein [Flammeovirgaceae bacterium]